MGQVEDIVRQLDRRYEGVWTRLEETITPQAVFEVFQQLSDNYSPTLTVSRVQGSLVERLARGENGGSEQLRVTHNTRGSGSISVTIGEEPAPVWLSAHADICSYLTGAWDGERYTLTPFCMHRARPGRRAAAALGTPAGTGSLERLAYGEMVTDEAGRVFFETDRDDLPLWTRVVHHLPATWDRESDEIHGFIDNQGSGAALILAARVLAHYAVNALLLLNDEEEGPVDKGNQGFSRALTRLLNRTPHEKLPQLVVVSDVHTQDKDLEAGGEAQFGRGALFSGAASGARGAVVPPQILASTRELATALRSRGIRLTENPGYVSRSDDISAMQYTQNIALIGYPGAYAHFDRTPVAHCGDLAHLAKTLVVVALLAQDEEWRDRVL